VSGRRRRPVDVDRIVFRVALVLLAVVLVYASVHIVSGDL
jgi:hypothetical protein